MIYQDFQGMKLSMLGFGTMRLPVLPDGEINVSETREMTKWAIEHGINYFDTAMPYHGGKSEIVMGQVLKDYPRDSYYLATKYPGHQISSSYDPKGTFETQLKKCDVDYFDFYLLHNVYENSIQVYKDPKWGILEYFKEQRANGRIRHLGFSTHARPETMREFLEYCRETGLTMEFCQIQLNYLDWTLQDAKKKCEILKEFGIPVWVMEPIRGGRLADDVRSAFRFLMDIPGVTVVLSGMSSLQQMQENTEIFDHPDPLSPEEKEALLMKAEGMKNSLPCTACRYCCDGCPMGLDIPVLIAAYNDMKFGGSNAPVLQMDALPEDKLPSACIGCGACAAICPQKIDIPAAMAELAEMYAKAPKWADICREREEAAKRLAEGK